MERNRTAIKILITGGGTGGHLFPGIAVAEEFLSRFAKSEVLFVGTERQIDAQAFQGRQFSTATIPCSGLKGKGCLAKLKTLLQLPLSLVAAIGILRRFKPVIVIGVGGYVTGPVVLAARLLGIATCIHEQNSVPGLANRLLGRFVDRIFLSIPGSEQWFPTGKTFLTGNPVRTELLDNVLDASGRGKEIPTLLVLGGSQGAHRVNTLVVEALIQLHAESPGRFKVVHQTGLNDESVVRRGYQEAGIQAKVAAFFDNMKAIYGAADFVVSRAGATTLAELSVQKIPALLIPFPYAADDHQEKNAAYLVEAGAAKMFKEQDLTGEKLGREIRSLLTDPSRRHEMGESMGRMALPQATENIIRECLVLLEQHGKGPEEAVNANSLQVW